MTKSASLHSLASLRSVAAQAMLDYLEHLQGGSDSGRNKARGGFIVLPYDPMARRTEGRDDACLTLEGYEPQQRCVALFGGQDNDQTDWLRSLVSKTATKERRRLQNLECDLAEITLPVYLRMDHLLRAHKDSKQIAGRVQDERIQNEETPVPIKSPLAAAIWKESNPGRRALPQFVWRELMHACNLSPQPESASESAHHSPFLLCLDGSLGLPVESDLDSLLKELSQLAQDAAMHVRVVLPERDYERFSSSNERCAGSPWAVFKIKRRASWIKWILIPVAVVVAVITPLVLKLKQAPVPRPPTRATTSSTSITLANATKFAVKGAKVTVSKSRGNDCQVQCEFPDEMSAGGAVIRLPKDQILPHAIVLEHRELTGNLRKFKLGLTVNNVHYEWGVEEVTNQWGTNTFILSNPEKSEAKIGPNQVSFDLDPRRLRDASRAASPSGALQLELKNLRFTE